MATHARGLICLTLLPERCQALGLTQMAEHNTEAHETAFTVSIDAAARFGVTTGISAADPPATIRVAVDPASVPTDLRRPGHVFPVAGASRWRAAAGRSNGSQLGSRAARGAVPGRGDLRDSEPDGSMARQQDLRAVRRATRAHLHHRRRASWRIAWRTSGWCTRWPRRAYPPRSASSASSVTGTTWTRPSMWRWCTGTCRTDERAGADALQVPHGDVFGSGRCDCGWQLHSAMRMIAAGGGGVVVYLDQEGRGIGLLNKLKAYELQDAGTRHRRGQPRARLQAGPAQLRQSGRRSSWTWPFRDPRLTNNPMKLVGLEATGLEIVERVPIVMTASDENRSYLDVKRDKLRHLLPH